MSEDTEIPEERRGRQLTPTDKFMNAFWNFQGAYFTVFGWVVHVMFVAGGIFYLVTHFGN